MPFYEYECANCKFYKEVMQKVSDAPLKKCPSCGKNALKKLVSAPVFRLKGAGWYETDFKSDAEKKRNLADKEPEKEKKETAEVKEAAPGDAKGEAKPAEKADAAKADAKGAESKPASAEKSAAERDGARRGTRSTRRSAKPVAKSSAKVRVKRKAAAKKKRR
jgi:putative FmdB family regulatory protein